MIVQHSIEHYCVAGMAPIKIGAGRFILVSPPASYANCATAPDLSENQHVAKGFSSRHQQRARMICKPKSLKDRNRGRLFHFGVSARVLRELYNGS